MSEPIEALIFDMDGTVVDNMGVHQEAWDAWHDRQGLPFDAKTFFARTAGRTNAEIAGTLYMSPKTASVHVTHIIAKLGAANRTEAAAIARRQGLLQ